MASLHGASAGGGMGTAAGIDVNGARGVGSFRVPTRVEAGSRRASLGWQPTAPHVTRLEQRARWNDHTSVGSQTLLVATAQRRVLLTC